MSATAREFLLTALCLAGLASLVTGAMIAWGLAGMLMVVGALLFVIFLAMLT